MDCQIFAQQSRQLRAVVGQIVAAKQGQAGQRRSLARCESLMQKPKDAAGVGQVKIEAAVVGAAITLLGDGEADDVGARRSNGCDDLLRLRDGDQHPLHCGDHAQLVACRRARDQRVQAILRTQLFSDRARTQRYADDTPVALAVRHGVVGIDGLVGAMEGTDAEMHDPGALLCAIIARAVDPRRQRTHAGGSQPHSRYARLARP